MADEQGLRELSECLGRYNIYGIDKSTGLEIIKGVAAKLKAMGWRSPEEVKALILDEHEQHSDDVEWDREKVARQLYVMDCGEEWLDEAQECELEEYRRKADKLKEKLAD